MKKKLMVVVALIFAIAVNLIPVAAVEEGRPETPNAFDGTEFVEAFDVSLLPIYGTRKVREVYLGSYTIKQYLNSGYMKFTDESFDASKFPDDGAFKFETNLTTDGTDKDIKVGIAYVNFWGDDVYLVSTKMGLSDSKIFTCDKKPSQDKNYYGCITNDTGGKMYGSFTIYAVYPN